MNKLFLAALLASAPVAAEAQVVISFSHAADSFSTAFAGTLTIDPALLGPNMATSAATTAPDAGTSYSSLTSLFTVALTSNNVTYTLAGTPNGADIFSSREQDGTGAQFDQFADDGSSTGSSFYLTNQDYTPTASTADFGNVLLPDLRLLPNVYVTFSSGGANFAGLVTVSYANAVAQVPEPAGWAMMIAGFGMIGGAMRRRPRVAFA